MIQEIYTFHVEDADFKEIHHHLLQQVMAARGDDDPSLDRYRRVYALWLGIQHNQDLHMKDVDERILWDLWGAIPDYGAFGQLRDRLIKYLERSALLKLAECADEAGKEE